MGKRKDRKEAQNAFIKECKLSIINVILDELHASKDKVKAFEAGNKEFNRLVRTNKDKRGAVLLAAHEIRTEVKRILDERTYRSPGR